MKDHLGNTRVSIDDNGGGTVARVIQEDEYYAFGLNKNLITSGNKNNYLYNGKEEQDALSDQYDYGTRFYDPVIGRWNVVDPLEELDRKTTPYAYAFDDPIRHTDPDGMFGEDVNKDFDQQEGVKPKPKQAVSAAGATTVGGAILRAVATIGEGVEIVGTGAATALVGTVALVFLPTEAGRGSDKPPRPTLPPPLIPPNLLKNSQDNASASKPNPTNKENRRADAEHTSNQQEKNRNTHEDARARKNREQAKADEKYNNTKSTKRDTRSNNQKKKDDPNYKRTGSKTEE